MTRKYNSEVTELSPTALLQKATNEVPAVKYALGVGGVAAVVAIVLTGWKLEPQLAVFGTLVVFIFMVVLVVFAALSRAAPIILRPLVLFLAWSFLIITVVVAILFVGCAFFDIPKTLPCLLQGQCNNSPQTVTASSRYEYEGGWFKQVGDSSWEEGNINVPRPIAYFRELYRDNSYIYLVDKERTKEGSPNNHLHLRLPISGGTSQWSWQNPMKWIDLNIVNPR